MTSYTETIVDSAQADLCRQQVSTYYTCLAWAYNPGIAGRTNVICVRQKSGERLHNYKRRIAKGRNATTNFSASEDYYSSDPAREDIWGCTSLSGALSGWRKASASWSHGLGGVPALPDSGDVSIAANIASMKFYKKLESTMTAFQGGVFLAELRETLHMIRNPAMSLRKKVNDAIENLRKNRGKQMRRPPSNRLKFISDSWLEHSFGWSPLLNDLNEARNVLDKRQNQLLQELIPIIGVGSCESTYWFNQSFVSGVSNLAALIRQKNQTMQIYAGAVSSVASGTPLLNFNALGLSPRSFVPTLWEAMPYSFLIDYFSNVGDVLSAWSNQSTGLAWGRQTTRRVTTQDSTGCYGVPDGLLPLIVEYTHHGGKTTARKKSVTRAPMGSAPIPTLQFELPGFGRKWINLSALATARRSLRFR